MFEGQATVAPAPVTVQPVNVVNNVSVSMNQPTAPKQEGPRPWRAHLCACMNDLSTCCCVMVTGGGPCYISFLSNMMGESYCLPYCVPENYSVAMLRVKLRTHENIEGSLLKDACVSTCCMPCAICQLKREFDMMVATNNPWKRS